MFDVEGLYAVSRNSNENDTSNKKSKQKPVTWESLCSLMSTEMDIRLQTMTI